MYQVYFRSVVEINVRTNVYKCNNKILIHYKTNDWLEKDNMFITINAFINCWNSPVLLFSFNLKCTQSQWDSNLEASKTENQHYSTLLECNINGTKVRLMVLILSTTRVSQISVRKQQYRNVKKPNRMA